MAQHRRFPPDCADDGHVGTAAPVDFAIGGEIDVVSATKDGLYNGDLNVTVTYQ